MIDHVDKAACGLMQHAVRLSACLLLSSLTTLETTVAQESIPRTFEVASIKRSAADAYWGYDVGRGERVHSIIFS